MSILNVGEMQLWAISVSLRGENDFHVLFYTIRIIQIAMFVWLCNCNCGPVVHACPLFRHKKRCHYRTRSRNRLEIARGLRVPRLKIVKSTSWYLDKALYSSKQSLKIIDHYDIVSIRCHTWGNVELLPSIITSGARLKHPWGTMTLHLNPLT